MLEIFHYLPFYDYLRHPAGSGSVDDLTQSLMLVVSKAPSYWYVARNSRSV